MRKPSRRLPDYVAERTALGGNVGPQVLASGCIFAGMLLDLALIGDPSNPPSRVRTAPVTEHSADNDPRPSAPHMNPGEDPERNLPAVRAAQAIEANGICTPGSEWAGKDRRTPLETCNAQSVLSSKGPHADC